ncbi:MAG TPA: glycosyltransferase family 39 protein [Gemmatimonadales bacterium]
MTSAVGRPVPARPVAWALLGLGVLVRVVGYFHRSSLWGDEAMLGLNLGARSFGQLTRPLDYAQVAPIPFLWGERTLAAIGGVNEYTLRLIPLLAGIVLLFALFRLAQRRLEPAEALVALALAATAFPLIRYSDEVKPYSIDAFVTIAVIGLALDTLRELDAAERWRRLVMAGALAVVLSIPAIFVCAGVSLGLSIECLRRRPRGWLVRLGTATAIWVGLAGLTYLIWYRAAAGGSYMRQYWEATFLRPGTPAWGHRLGLGAQEAVCSLNCWRGLLNLAPLYGLLVVLGLWVLFRRQGPAFAALLILPLLLAFAASFAGRYPIATRLLLYAAPLVVLLVAVGLVASATWFAGRLRWLQPRWVLAIFLLPSVVLTTSLAIDPPQETGFSKEEIRSLAAQVEGRSAGEPVYVYHRATPAWVFYTTDWRAPDTARLGWVSRVAGPDGLGFVNGRSRGPRRAEDGDSLSRDYRGRLELLGTYSGSQGRQWQAYVPPHPDPGWAEAEAERMRRVGKSGLWIVLTDYRHPPQDDGAALLDAVKKKGGLPTLELRASEAAAYRIQFDTLSH